MADPHRPHHCNGDRKVGRSCGLIDIKQSLVMNTGLVGSDACLGGAALAQVVFCTQRRFFLSSFFRLVVLVL